MNTFLLSLDLLAGFFLVYSMIVQVMLFKEVKNGYRNFKKAWIGLLFFLGMHTVADIVIDAEIFFGSAVVIPQEYTALRLMSRGSIVLASLIIFLVYSGSNFHFIGEWFKKEHSDVQP